MKTKKTEKVKKEVLPDYKTCDLNEASAITMHVKVKGVEGEGQRMFFIFPGEAKEYAGKYWSGEMNGNIREYASAIKAMKDMLFHYKRNGWGQ